MVFVSYTTRQQDLTTDNAIRAGSDEVYVFTVADANGPANMSEWVGTLPRSEFRTPAPGTASTATKVGCAQPTMSWLNGGLGGEIQMAFANADTAGKSLAGGYDIEVIHSSGKVTRVFFGNFTVSPEVTTGASP